MASAMSHSPAARLPFTRSSKRLSQRSQQKALQFTFVTNGWHFDRVYPVILKHREAVKIVAFSLDGADARGTRPLARRRILQPRGPSHHALPREQHSLRSEGWNSSRHRSSPSGLRAFRSTAGRGRPPLRALTAHLRHHGNRVGAFSGGAATGRDRNHASSRRSFQDARGYCDRLLQY